MARDLFVSETSLVERSLETLVTSLLELAAQQHEALLRGDLDALLELSRRRGSVYKELAPFVATNLSKGCNPGHDETGNSNPVATQHSMRLRQLAQQILALDEASVALIDDAMRRNRAEMERVRCGRLALQYRRRSGHKKANRVDMVS